MIVERDIAGFALPFAAATAAAVLLVTPYSTFSYISASLAFTLSILFTVLLVCLQNSRKAVTEPLIFGAAVSCGLLTGLTEGFISISDADHIGTISRFAAGFAERLKEATDSIPFADRETSGIIKALITGDRSNLSFHTEESFRASGASHILALSGFHLGIIYGIVRKAAGCIGNSPGAEAVKAISTIIICGFYTLATGAGASIVRAFIFIMVREISRLTHRHTSLKHTLLTSLTVHLAIYPGDVSGIGFQLSYAAMAGIAFIFPYLKELWPDDGSFNPLRKVWESAALSISCQITTGPLAYICFGTFPKYFLLSNLIALPLTGAIIPISILTVAMYTAGICPGILIRFTEAAVQVMCRSLDIISGM